ncbi:MAG: glycerol-3-phosphate dehydrogenase [Pseudomonadales bacterium]|nr:glycerol-3-phosphate dehydrogenase [Pseudomonadales bacterium]
MDRVMDGVNEAYDLAVLGGGINGTGIAADAAGRGLRVILLEQDDLGAATSSASSKLVHGGLRYLETREFALVRKALKESQLLLERAPHLIAPIAIHLPYQRHLRPWLVIRAGLFLYNHLAARPSYPRARAIRFDSTCPLRSGLRRGFSFSDGQVDDSRLVIANAMRARELGAEVKVRHRCEKLRARAAGWELAVRDLVNTTSRQFQARVIVNAAGPWVSSLFETNTGAPARRQVRLVKGSHLLVPRAYPGDQAYMLQNEDGRIVFVIPYRNDFTMIGTTEAEFSGDPATVAISQEEIGYLLEVYNSYFRRELTAADVVNTWSGVRPLIDDQETTATRTSRDYQLLFEQTSQPLLSVYGGKLTTYRVLAEQAVDRLGEHFPGLPASRTAQDNLPGGDFSSREQLTEKLQQEYPWLAPQLVQRFVTSYGSLTAELLAGCCGPDHLGIAFGHGLSQREVDYLVNREWARTAEDILWRRSRLGLYFSPAQEQGLRDYLSRSVGAT